MKIILLSNVWLLCLADAVLVSAYSRPDWILPQRSLSIIALSASDIKFALQASSSTLSAQSNDDVNNNTSDVAPRGAGAIESKQNSRSLEKYAFVKRTLLQYKVLRNDMLVPRRFVVPDKCDKWPEEMWGMKLGDVVNNIRRGISYTDKREELLAIGFCLGVAQARYRATKSALLTYRKIHNDMLVARRFVVPHNSEEWAEELWGMKLGETVYNIRRGVNYVDKREDLVKIGFYFESQLEYDSDIVVLALLKFKELNGNFLVPVNFIVPEVEGKWPEKTWGMNLGSVVVNIKSGLHAGRREELLSRGIVFEASEVKYNLIKRALENFKSLNGHMLVPTRFVVPSASGDWPEDLWDLKLGSTVSKIRSGDYADKQEELLAIGFCYNVVLAKYNLAKTALLNYKHLYGNMLVPQRFVVPSNCQKWPQETWGMKLGTLVDSVRQGLSHADRRGELTSLGFDFSPQAQSAYGFDAVCAALCRFKEMEGHMLVPRSYGIPDPCPGWPQETWGMKLGTHVNSIRNGRSHVDRREELLGIGFVYVARKIIEIDRVSRYKQVQ